jgi:hypothetical protein
MMPRKTSREHSLSPWPGLTRPPTSSGEAVTEVFPEPVIPMDELRLPSAAPVFDVHLALFYRSPNPRAMMPRKTSRVPPWIVNFGAISVV